MNEPIELSIITVNYNGLKDTELLIESLQDSLIIPYEIIVIDNGSVNDEAAALKEKYPFLKTIRSERNLGFAGGNNLGIRQAVGSYLFLLNNDTYVTDNSISDLLNVMKQKPSLGGVSPKILFADREGGIQFAGYTLLSRITLRNRLIGYREKDMGQHDKPCPTPYLHGAAMLIRREVIERAGMIPEIYFLYYEELDWSLQICRQGYQLEYNPIATIYHRESSSSGQNSPLKAYYLTRNRLLFARRNLPSPECFFSVAYQLVVAIPKGLIQALLKRKFILIRAMFKACRDFFKMRRNE